MSETRKYNDEDLERIKKKRKRLFDPQEEAEEDEDDEEEEESEGELNRRWKRLCPLQGSLQV